MSADNYLYVRVRPDGKFGISHRFVSTYYLDEDGGDSVPDHWFCREPDDLEVYDGAAEAVLAAHRMYERETFIEYGVHLGVGVSESAA